VVSTEVSKIRTIAIAGQNGVGKTSVADALVYAAGGNNRLGRVDDETSLFDTEPEEMRRRSTITASIYTLPWNKHSVTIVDTPGQGNFVLDTAFTLRGVGAVLLVLDPSAPVRAETVKIWSWAKKENLPVVAFVNRLDRPDIDLEGYLATVGAALDARATLVQLPIGTGDALGGIVDLLTGTAYRYEKDTGKFQVGDIPGVLKDRAAAAKAALTESAAESDDELIEKYLEAGELSDEDVRRGLAAGVASGALLPVFCGSAARNIGFPQLLDAIVEIAPPPAALGVEAARDEHDVEITVEPDPAGPASAFVFKTIIDPHAGQLSVMRVLSGTITGDTQLVNTRTRSKERVGHLLKLEGKKTVQVPSASVGEIVALAKLKDTHSGDTLADPARPVAFRPFESFHPAISFAIAAKKRGDEDKAVQGLLKLAQEDLGLRVERGDGTADILLSGAGQLHVEVACERLARKYNVEVELKAPQVPYRETIRKAVKAHGRLKKQTGGHGQFADCKIEVEPLPRGSGFQFESKVVGGAIPRNFIPAVEKGVVDAMKAGSLGGYPVVDVKVAVYDGQYHDVDSSEMAFKIAGSMAFKDALEQASPCLLEPIVNLAVSVPDECRGDVMGDLNSRRAKVEGMEQQGHSEIIRAKVPLAEVLRYAPDLTSMTSGRGSFEMGFSHYEPLPEHLAPKVIEAARRARGEGSA
jgi:elongation factor G